jgi:MarR-like DNA-binding transcriptional regulator SgrR of sgrS sRNA
MLSFKASKSHMSIQSPASLRRSLRLVQAQRETMRTEKSWISSKASELSVSLQILKHQMDELDTLLKRVDNDAIELQTFMDDEGIPLTDSVEELLDQRIGSKSF